MLTFSNIIHLHLYFVYTCWVNSPEPSLLDNAVSIKTSGSNILLYYFSFDSPLISGRGTPVLGMRSARRESSGKPLSPKSSRTNNAAPSKPSHDTSVINPEPITTTTPRSKSAKPFKANQSIDGEMQVKKSRVNTPRTKTPRAKTPRALSSRADAFTPRRSKTYHGEMERPLSRAIGNYSFYMPVL